ncbi:MAG: hypothetical protein ACJ8M1_11260 [Chthoniobacterales bacterium]
MKTPNIFVLTALLALTSGAGGLGQAQSVSTTAAPTDPDPPAEAAVSFEELPELSASEILKPEFLKGPHHSVRESVPTASGANQFIIDSDFGVFDADGNEMLLRRIREVYAIAALKEVSRTDQFKESLTNAAKGTFNAAKSIVTDPRTTISNVPKGVMKFMGRAGQSVKNMGKNKDDDGTNGTKLEKMVGFSTAKRKIAVSMGVDPYSTNTVLQKQLDDIAWASWAGGFVFSAGTFPIGGPVGVALTVTTVGDSLNKIVQEKPPADLKQMNRASLRAMGVGERDTERFLGNTAFSPTQQTAFVLNLKTLDGVTNRAGFVHAAAEESSNESDALFCVETSELMSRVHTDKKPIVHIVMIENFPICVAKDGAIVLALQWDYAAWTTGAAALTADVQKLAAQSGPDTPVLVELSGQVSSRLRQELEGRAFTVEDRVSEGPLK